MVTGVGLVCALGIGTEESWKNLVAGQSGIGPITQFDTNGFDCKIAGEIKNFDPFLWIEKKELKKMGRFIQVALAAADFAVKSANWKKEDSDLDEVGVYVSSGIGGFDIALETGAGRSGQDFSFLYSFRDCEPCFGAHFDSLRRARAEFRDGDGLLRFRACDWRLLQDH